MHCAASRPLMPMFPRALSPLRVTRRVLKPNLKCVC
jgi:hypothetical protein